MQDRRAARHVGGGGVERIARRHVVVGDGRDAFEHAHRLFRRELVEIAGHHDFGVGIAGQQVVDEIVDRLRLRGALDLAGVERRLDRADHRAAAALRGEVVVDDRDLVAVELEGRDQRRAGAEERIVRIGLLIERGRASGRVDRDAVHADGAQRVVDKVDPVGAIEKGGADVAAGLAAVGVVADERIVDGTRTRRPRRATELMAVTRSCSVRLAARGRGVAGAVVVLNLLQRDDVRRLEAVDDLVGDGREARGRIERVEVLGVVARDRQPVGGAGQGSSSPSPACSPARRRRPASRSPRSWRSCSSRRR